MTTNNKTATLLTRLPPARSIKEPTTLSNCLHVKTASIFKDLRHTNPTYIYSPVFYHPPINSKLNSATRAIKTHYNHTTGRL